MTIVRNSPSGEPVDLGQLPSVDISTSLLTEDQEFGTGTAEYVQSMTTLRAASSTRIVEFQIPAVSMAVATAECTFYIDRQFADVSSTVTRIKAAICGVGQKSAVVRAIDTTPTTGTVALYFLKVAASYGTGAIHFVEPGGTANTSPNGTVIAL